MEPSVLKKRSYAGYLGLGMAISLIPALVTSGVLVAVSLGSAWFLPLTAAGTIFGGLLIAHKLKTV